MNDLITINIIEAATELAAVTVAHKTFYKEDDNEYGYTNEAQEIFDSLYDKYYNILSSIAVTDFKK